MTGLNKFIVFSAPSGSGKTTLVRYLLGIPGLPLGFSVSATSRAPRRGEIHGEAYFFLSPEEFKAKIAQNAFLEYEEVYKDHFYGTLQSEITRFAKEGKHVIFDIDVEGGLNIKARYPERTLAIFVRPPGLEALEQRLISRGDEPLEKIKMRLQKAKAELLKAPQFDVILENDELEKAKAEARQIVSRFIGVT